MHNKAPEYHTPVLGPEVSKHLITDPNGVYVDATLGGGGHAEILLKALGSKAKLIGIDRDPDAIEAATKRLATFKDRVLLNRAPFWNLQHIIAEQGPTQIAGILFDLGISSHQIDDAKRGFSFQQNGPLDMRMGPDAKCTASEVVNSYSQKDLTQIIKTYGEERAATRIARAICLARPIECTNDLTDVIAQHIRGPQRQKTLARVFQAIRIEVNDELTQLEQTLQTAIDLLAPNGRIGVLSYHSLEHRVVKQVFGLGTRDCIGPIDLPICPCERVSVLTLPRGRNIRPEQSEIENNPRARSATLRLAQRRNVPAQPWICLQRTLS
ncbi:MAG: 16S rRNA (cytosine(1402)-N(4))-methyltransferase RsmH [Candidatus Latescibacteria bacterium]|nr:16S rRNA (cytosine(1402)-N(4))-methyltransferase RsmH [Candidatus Latescibacterota bacterium]